MNRSVLAAAVVSLSFVLLADAAPGAMKPHGLFRDHAVLQRGIALPVWGATDSNEKVTVSLAGQQAAADPKDGRWRVEFNPLSAGGPHTLTISQGAEKIELKDVLIGEVWLCGGQSNMEWPLHATDGAKEAIDASLNESIRLFTVPRRGAPKPETDVGGEWSVCNPQSVPNFSAVGYHFGRELQKAIGVPVGLISSNIGGTTAERWMAREHIDSNPHLRGMSTPQGACDLYNAMIAPLAPFGVAGAIWYQGESNADRAIQYRKLMPAMIESWRRTIGHGDFPFLMVQLAPFMKIEEAPMESAWAELREAQLMSTSTCPNTGIAVITDVGDEKDIHPRKKAPVGARLALAARALAYGEKIEYSGPVVESMAVVDGKAVLAFTHAAGGLVAKDGEPKGFTIAGEDRKFRNAQARIERNRVIVWSDEVPHPVAVRYGWSNCPVVNLWNRAGLPASPFRTDAFPAVTERNK
jgi:sialate O-acetylesterase